MIYMILLMNNIYDITHEGSMILHMNGACV